VYSCGECDPCRTGYLQGRLNLDDLISERIRIEDINAGLEKLSGELARSVITFD
jgi:S-(hydroxymethyl)glutathione dehydrogenase / alcohol dehydrogenase